MSCLLPPLPGLLNVETGEHYKPSLISCPENSFAWSDNRYRCFHSPSLDNAAVESVVKNQCAVLSYFGMFILPSLSSIVCQHHRCLVPFGELRVHIRNRHKTALVACKWDLSELLDHIEKSESGSILHTKAEIWELALQVCLTEPLPGLQEPQLCIQCPVCKRGFLSHEKRRGAHFRDHCKREQSLAACREWFSKQNKNFKPSDMPRLYASSLFEGASCSTMRIMFSSDYRPSPGTTEPCPTPDPPVFDSGVDLPEYLIKLGWISYVQGLGARSSTLIQLVALPSPRVIDSWPENSEGYRVEEGLMILSSTLRLYLSTADTRVNSCHESVRDAIVGE